MKLHAALVTGFLCAIATCGAAQRRPSTPGPRGRATATTTAPPPLTQRIETSRGTCECVPYYDCDADNTVDTTIFRIRFRRQIEERPEQCTGLNVCCLVNKNTNNNGGNNNNNNNNNNNSNGGTNNNNGGNNNSNGGNNSNNGNTNGGNNNNNNGGNNNNNGNENNSNNGGNTNNGGGEPTDPDSTPTPCICLPEFQCGKNDSEVFQGGKGIIKPRIPCERGETLCCHPSFAGGFSPTPPSPTPDGLRTCGTRNKNIDFSINRIQTGGDGYTNFGEYPWMLVILKAETLSDGSVTNNAFVCGASLIQPSVAITAAHCVHNLRSSDLKIRAGEWDTRENNAAETLPYQEQRVAEVITHPRFNNGTLHNDVALLKLAAPFTLADNVGLVCLPGESSPDPSSCIATGWGKDAFSSDAKYQNVMKQVSLPYVPPGECQTKLRKTRLGNHFILDKSFNCAGGLSNEDTCQGDGGGPLSCIVSGDERFYLIGITSWGIGCGTNNVPGVYTNVRSFSDWISSHLE